MGYLKEMGSDDGEPLHGFRAGCAITLALSGAELSEIMDHAGWTRRHTALHYLQLAKVLNPAVPTLSLLKIRVWVGNRFPFPPPQGRSINFPISY